MIKDECHRRNVSKKESNLMPGKSGVTFKIVFDTIYSFSKTIQNREG